MLAAPRSQGFLTDVLPIPTASPTSPKSSFDGLTPNRAADPPTDGSAASWDARSFGGLWGHWLFHQIVKRLGHRFAHLVLYAVVAFYTLWASAGRAASIAYLDRALGPASGWTRWKRVYRHFHEYARTLLDGPVLGAHGPGVFRCVHQGLEHIREAAQRGAGVVLVTSHLGNWEVASGLLERELGEAKIALVMFRGDEERLQRFLETIRGKRPPVIAVGEGGFVSLEILHALRDGAIVAMPGDRSVDARDVTVPFLGEPARWPVGAWVMAALSGAPLVVTFALQTGPFAYHFIADPPRKLGFESGRPKDEQLREWVAQYVARVEELLRQYPYQWFNFFDFWAAQPKLPAAPPTPRARPG